MAKKSEVEDMISIDEYKRYKKLLIIERDDLEGSLTDQPMFFEEVSFRSVRASASRDKLKLKMDETAAELDHDIRLEAAQAETKITESAILNKIKLDKYMQEAQRAFYEAKELADLWSGLLQAYTQRSYALKDIVAIALRQMSMDGDIIASEKDRQSLLAAKSDRVSQEAGKIRRSKLAQAK